MVNIGNQNYSATFNRTTSASSFKLENKNGETSALSVESQRTSLLLNFKLDTKDGSNQSITEQFGALDKALKALDADQLEQGNFDLSSLSQDDAKSLVSKDGFFGVDKTSERIANFVIKGAGGDLEKLRAGREGMLQGFNEAEKSYGSKLPDISYETINTAVGMIDDIIKEAGGSVLDVSA